MRCAGSGGAVSSFECSVAGAIDQGCHTVFLGQVQSLRMGPGASLLYRGRILPSPERGMTRCALF
ncbi:MAG: flavin reductase family protein [Rhodobacter sp.]|nr:flavin reductase family protein [Rhodobacter sp.]